MILINLNILFSTVISMTVMAWYGRLCVLLFLVHLSLVCCDDDEETDFFEDGSLEGYDFQQMFNQKCEFNCKNGKRYLQSLL